MNLYTAEQMQAIDHHAVETIGIDAAALMETAGRAVAARALDMLPAGLGKRVLILAGKGNNGGDGFVIARTLAGAGAAVQIILSETIESGEGAAWRNLEAARYLGIPTTVFEPKHPLLTGDFPLDLCIDALLGVGQTGAPRGAIAQMVEAANQLSCPILAVDVPTGLDASTGAVSGACIRAAVTMTFGGGKVGLWSDPGRRYAGKVEVVDIGWAPQSILSVTPRTWALDAEMVAEWLPDRSDWANKGTFGSVAVVAGSSGMLGAAALCSRATLRVGAGLTRLIVPEALLAAANAMTLEVICIPAPSGPSGGFSADAAESVLHSLKSANAAAIGPGLSTAPEAAELVRTLLPQIKTPMVIDADALNILSQNMEPLRRLQAPVILTPHPGEMARLTGTSVADVQAGRIGTARVVSQTYGVVVVLKGAATVIAEPSGKTLINTTGNPGMATAGTGDVLTGTITGLLAQGLPPFEAAGAGAFLHGLAGDRCAARRGRAGLLASDLLDELPAAQNQVRSTIQPTLLHRITL